MGADPATPPLAVHVAADGTIWVDVGNRLVEVDDPVRTGDRPRSGLWTLTHLLRAFRRTSGG